MQAVLPIQTLDQIASERERERESLGTSLILNVNCFRPVSRAGRHKLKVTR